MRRPFGDGSHDRAGAGGGQYARPEVAGVAQPGGEHRLGRPLVVGDPGAQGGRAPDQLRAGQDRRAVALVDRGEAGEDRRAHALDRVLSRRARADQLGHQRVVVVGRDDVLLGREVAEERHVRDAGRGGDLLHRGLLVAVLEEQAHGRVLDALPRLGLLALAQAHAAGVRPSRRAQPMAASATTAAHASSTLVIPLTNACAAEA